MWRFFQFCCRSPQKKQQKIPNLIQEKQFVSPTPFPDLLTKKKSSQILPKPVNVKRQNSSDSSIKMKQNRYQGETLDQRPHGSGSMYFANGDFYRGQWVNGRKQGHGLQIYQQLNIQYQGQWQDDVPNGQGKMLYHNGSYYIGEFSNGNKHGRGQYYDAEKKKQFNQTYQDGNLKQKIQVKLSGSKQQEFPTLVLDKQRFNTEDLQDFQNKNSQTKQFDIVYLLQYYGLCKLVNLQFISKSVKQWTIKQVLQLLTNIQLIYYRQIFYKNKVKGKDLISLSDQELMKDLNMKMGDRRRLKNYITFILELQAAKKKQQKINKKQQYQNRRIRRLGSHFVSKKSIVNKKSALYQESIKQQQQSDDSDPGFKSTQKVIMHNQIQVEASQQRYISAAFQGRYMMKSPQQIYSQKKQAQSQRSSNTANRSPKINRKSSRDFDHFQHLNDSALMNTALNIYNPTDKKKQSNAKLEDVHSLQQKLGKSKKSESNCSSATSSSSERNNQVRQIVRKKTTDKSHHYSQIRQLYDFLKQQQSLNFLMKQKQIQRQQLIGEGGYGKVYKAKYAGSDIAIKYYQKTRNIRHKQDFMKELQIISNLKHPNIVLYMGICITANRYALITQYLKNGSLFDQIHKKKTKFSPQRQIQMAYDIVKGMVYLHQIRNTLHRDLKSSNVLIGQDWKLKLCDFGLSGQKKKLKKSKHRIGTYQWMAPQVIRNDDKIDEHSDVYSFGVIIWQMLTEKIPYEGLADNQIIGLIGHDPTHQLEQPPQGCPFLKQIMRKCLKRQASNRPYFSDIFNQFDEYLTVQKEKQSHQKYNQ